MEKGFESGRDDSDTKAQLDLEGGASGSAKVNLPLSRDSTFP